MTRVARKRSEYKNSDRLRSDSDRLPINVDRQGRIENEAINVDRQAIGFRSISDRNPIAHLYQKRILKHQAS